MYKYEYKIIFSILIGILLINVALFFTWTYKKYDDVYVINPLPENMQFTTELYFVHNDNLMSEIRTVDIKNDEFEHSIFEELIKGPKTKFFENVLPENVKLDSFEVIDDVIYINFNSKFINNDFFNDDNFYLHLMSMVDTLTDIKHFMKVQFLVDGEKVLEKIHGVSIMEPLKRDERVIYKRDVNSSDTVISFIEMIFNRRFDLAYESLNEYSKQVYPYNVFKETMESYIYYHEGYQRNIYFLQSYDKYDIVNVKFVEIEGEDGNREEILEQWKVYKIDENFTIDLTELKQSLRGN